MKFCYLVILIITLGYLTCDSRAEFTSSDLQINDESTTVAEMNRMAEDTATGSDTNNREDTKLNDDDIKSSSFITINACGEYFTYKSDSFALTNTYGLISIPKQNYRSDRNSIIVKITVRKKLNSVSRDSHWIDKKTGFQIYLNTFFSVKFRMNVVN